MCQNQLFPVLSAELLCYGFMWQRQTELAIFNLLDFGIHYIFTISVYHCSSYRARQLYKNISMLFLFPVKDGKLSTGVNATFDASCYG